MANITGLMISIVLFALCFFIVYTWFPPIPYVSYYVNSCEDKLVVRMDDTYFPVGNTKYVLTWGELINQPGFTMVETSTNIVEAASWSNTTIFRFPKRRSEENKFLKLKKQQQ